MALGRHLAERGLTLVYGGGAVGLMGTVADAAWPPAAVIGIIPQSLQEAEIGHKGLTRLEVVDGMHARKARMASWPTPSSPCPAGSAPWKSCSRSGPGANWATTPSRWACSK